MAVNANLPCRVLNLKCVAWCRLIDPTQDSVSWIATPRENLHIDALDVEQRTEVSQPRLPSYPELFQQIYHAFEKNFSLRARLATFHLFARSTGEVLRSSPSRLPSGTDMKVKRKLSQFLKMVFRQ